MTVRRGFSLRLTLPASAPAAVPDTGGCEPFGPYLAWRVNGFGATDGGTRVFAIYGLPEGAVVEWSLSDLSEPLGSFFFVPGDVYDATVFVLVSTGQTGTVTAAVDGEAIGSLAFGAEP